MSPTCISAGACLITQHLRTEALGKHAPMPLLSFLRRDTIVDPFVLGHCAKQQRLPLLWTVVCTDCTWRCASARLQTSCSLLHNVRLAVASNMAHLTANRSA